MEKTSWTSASWALLGTLALIFAALLFSGTQEKQSHQALDLSIPWSLNQFHTQNALRYAHEVEALTDGRVTIRVHPGAILGIKGPDSLRAAADGIVPLVEMAGFQQVGRAPLLGLESLPFLINTQEELRILYEIMRIDIETLFEEQGLKLLYVVPWPNQNLYTKGPVQSLADLQGVKIRSQDVNTTRLMRDLGLIPLQMPAPDVVPALATGAIDATMTSTTTGAAQKYWEFLSHIYRSNHIWVSNMLVIHMDIWNGFTKADQHMIEQATQRLEEEFWAISKADDKKQLERLLDQNMTVDQLPDDVAQVMRSKARPIWRDFVKRVPEARPILDRYLERTGRPALEREE